MERGIPIAIVNQGVTRTDDLTTLIIDDDCTSVLDTAVAGIPAQRH